jgi:hypothetical protein
VKNVKSFGSQPTLYPTKNTIDEDDDKTVITSNISGSHELCGVITQPRKPSIPLTHAVADTGATSVFVLKGTKMKNIRSAVTLLVVNLLDGTVMRSMHVCDYEIPGLPTLLKAHIVPDLTVASLIGIHVLCKAGCVVIFTDKMCSVKYGGKDIFYEATKIQALIYGSYPSHPTKCADKENYRPPQDQIMLPMRPNQPSHKPAPV